MIDVETAICLQRFTLVVPVSEWCLPNESVKMLELELDGWVYNALGFDTNPPTPACAKSNPPPFSRAVAA